MTETGACLRCSTPLYERWESMCQSCSVIYMLLSVIRDKFGLPWQHEVEA